MTTHPQSSKLHYTQYRSHLYMLDVMVLVALFTSFCVEYFPRIIQIAIYFFGIFHRGLE